MLPLIVRLLYFVSVVLCSVVVETVVVLARSFRLGTRRRMRFDDMQNCRCGVEFKLRRKKYYGSRASASEKLSLTLV